MEPLDLVDCRAESNADSSIKQCLDQMPLSGKRVLIAGGPARYGCGTFLSNPSSGKSAVALALESARRGAQVSLVLGPSNELLSCAGGARVWSQQRRCLLLCERYASADLIIMCAAVADWTPVHQCLAKRRR